VSKFPAILSLVTLALSPALADDLKDPMAPFTARSSTTSSKAAPLVLSGVIIGPQRRIAIINDQPYRVGSEVGDYQLTAINKHSVEISSDGSTRKLVLRAESVRSADEPD
jgi:hypothetical protein